MLDAAAPVDRFYFIAAGEGAIDDPERLLRGRRLNELPLLRLVKSLARRSDRDAAIDAFIITFDPATDPNGGGLDGLACAIAQSDHRFRVRTIALCRREAREEGLRSRLFDHIHAEGRSARGEPVLIEGGTRSVRSLLPLRWGSLEGTSGFEREGVYLILGGSGVLGGAVTRRLVEGYRARVVWMGRSPADAEAVRRRLAEYADPATRPLYIQADALDPAALERGVAEVRRRLGRIDGAFFAGKVFSLDNTLERTDEQAFGAIVDIRTRGVLNLYRALREAAPGFLCCFSSVQAFPFLPASESVSYAAGITAADRLVRSLAAGAPFPVGIVNWGYWASSVVGTEVEEGLARHFRFISDAAGFQFLERFVHGLRAGVLDQVLCVGVRESVERLMDRHPTDGVSVAVPAAGGGLPPLPPPEGVPSSGVATRDLRQTLDRWTARLLHAQLRRCERGRVVGKYRRLLREFDAIPDPGGEDAPVWRAWADYRAALPLPELRAAADLVDGCLKALPEILCGALPATDALFPGGSLRKVEALYRDNGLSDHFNRRLAGVVEAFVAAHPGPVRLIEIGAGTGATTAEVTARLRPHLEKIREYRYTDLSQAFLIEAGKRYGASFPAMSYGLLDIQRPLAEQGVAVGGYDVVIATNVLHATRDIRETLRNTKATLKRGGIFLLNEIVEKSVVGSVTFGLLDGWWLYDDEELRIPGSPLLEVEGWRRAMVEEGFHAVTALTRGAAELGQEVMLGVSDGLIRQPFQRAEAPPVKAVSAPAPVSAPAVDVEALVRGALEDSLGGGSAAIARDVAFSDFGVDSILGVGFVERINGLLGLDLNATILFEQTTLERLSAYIRDRLPRNSAAETPPPAPRAEESSPVDAIAVIGLSGRFPGANDAEGFWRALMSGRSVVGELPAPFDRHPGGYRWGRLLADRDAFDPLFFNISPREAESMNRHQRLILQEGWRALEDAGYNPKGLAESRTGIFVGAEPGAGVGMGGSFTGASDAIIASRLSYFLGLRGPALVVNTGCSSSGVALHLACQSLRDRDSDLALAAGVSATLNPVILAALAETGMLSPTGRCRSFDHRADGTVLSEGVGVVVLKRLGEALAAGDTIHGVIIASGINQDGASNGITAPSGSAQEALIVESCRRFRIDPRAISYVETHGTGTRLGDPVEANALKRAFAAFTAAQGFCGVGSAKAHIGHTSAASGVIGLIKVLLSMRHHTLPPLPGFERLNERIEFAGSPFHIVAEATPWGGDGEPVTAALNSFGHSGTNAHLVIREHVTGPARRRSGEGGPWIVPLSARDQPRLKAMAVHLSAFLKAHPTLDPRDIAHTLQVGREAMESRVAFAITTLDELTQRLDAFVGGAPGEAVDGAAEGARGARISLPTYPFATDLYPISDPIAASPPPAAGAEGGHPLVQRNDSGFEGLRFSATFTGAEFFLADHQVGGRRLLPGVACLELARAAVERAAGVSPARLEDVTWERPFEVDDQPVDIHVALTRGDHGRVDYRIFSADSEGAERVHGRGVAFLAAGAETTRIDLAALAQATAPGEPTPEACAAAFEAMGVHYGPAFRAIDELRVGNGEVLARLVLPAVVAGSGERFVLHPSVMDGALQSAIALTLLASNGAAPSAPSLPFALERLDLLAPLPGTVHAWIRRAAGTVAGGKVEKLDLDLCDDQGGVLVRMRGFSSRRLPPEEPAPTGLSLMAPVWNAVPAATAETLDPAEGARVLIAGGTADQRALVHGLYPNARHLDFRPMIGGAEVELKIAQPFDHLVWIAPEPDPAAESLIDAQERGVLHLFHLIKALIRNGSGLDELSWTLITTQARPVLRDEPVDPTHAAVHGLAGSMAKEFPHWRVRLLDLEAGCPWPLREVFAAPFDPQGDARVRRGATWFTESLVRVDPPPSAPPPSAPSLYRRGGVYVVIGGAGGVGAVWSRSVIEGYGAQVVWIGRRPLDAAIQAKIDALSAVGPAPLYLQADAADRDALQSACDAVKRRFGRVDGVVHSAIVLLDKGLASMTTEDFRAGLKPKVAISVRLAQVFAGEPLDFVLFFSSLQSFTKAPGQSNYAAGCTFADSFAERLAGERRCAVKVMNWGYWGTVGVVADDACRERMARAGLDSIEPEEGMAGLESLMTGPFDRLALVKTLARAVDDPEEERVTLYPLAGRGSHPRPERFRTTGLQGTSVAAASKRSGRGYDPRPAIAVDDPEEERVTLYPSSIPGGLRMLES